MAKTQAFNRKPEELQAFLQYLEELNKKNKGSGLYEAYETNPRAFRVGEVSDPSGLGQDVQNDPIKYTQYSPSVIPFNAPNMGSVASAGGFDPSLYEQFVAQRPEQPQQAPEGSVEEFAQAVNQLVSYPVLETQDGGFVMSDGTVQYRDGTVRQATRDDVPQVLREFSDGSVMLTNGMVINPNARIGRSYQGLSGLSDLLFGRQQTVTQDYGNYNPELYGSYSHGGVDFRTRDLPEDFYFSLPFDAKVVRVDRAESGGAYGNSIELQLPNGNIIRLSHLADMENVQPGVIMKAFDYIGTPGNTGHSTGEHLDVEYFNANGQRMNPGEFMIDANDFVDYAQIEESMKVDQSKWQPEEKAFARAAQDLIDRGIEASPSPGMVEEYMRQDQEQELQQQQEQQQPEQPQNLGNQIANTINQVNPTGQYGIGVTELLQGDPEAAKRELGSTIEAGANKVGLNTEFGVSENPLNPFSPESEQARISALSRQPKEYNPYRQLAGNVSEWVGDKLGIPEGVISETIAGNPTVRTNQALAAEIGGVQPQQVPGIKQNLKDIGSDIKSKVGNVTGNIAEKARGLFNQAGEGVNKLKQEGTDLATGLFKKQPLMSLNEGQKQIGDEKGITQFEGTSPVTGNDTRDAFFKYGGADQFSQYLIDNAEQAKGGALSTSLFKPSFYQDPNAVGNVFGETSQGKEATGKYKNYLTSNIKPGYDQPYRTEIREEGDYLVEYQIPIKEYWENKYWQEQADKTPEVLKTGFSYDKYQQPTGSRSPLDKFSGAAQLADSPTVFKSGAVDLFRSPGLDIAKKAGTFDKPVADVYKSTTKSGQIEIPKPTSKSFTVPSVTSAPVSSATSRIIGLSPQGQAKQQQSSSGGGSGNNGGNNGGNSSNSSSSSNSNIARNAQQFVARATQPNNLSSWLAPRQTSQQQARAEIRNPSTYKSSQDWARLLIQGR